MGQMTHNNRATTVVFIAAMMLSAVAMSAWSDSPVIGGSFEAPGLGSGTGGLNASTWGTQVAGHGFAHTQFDSATLHPEALADRQPGSFGRWVRRSQAHRYTGFATLVLATATGVLGVAGAGDFHGPVAVATVATGITSATLGAVAYQDQLDRAWPHSLMNGLALGGMVANLVFFEAGSTAHIATGAASVGLMYGAYGYIAFAY